MLKNDTINPVGRKVKRRGIERRLDWKRSTHDEQNEKYRLQGLDCYAKNKHRKGGILRKQPLNLDQGREGACTGFGFAHTLAATPLKRIELTEADAFNFYFGARRNDEWAGEAYDGSSVNGVMTFGRINGDISSWRWIKTPDELKHALSYHGAVEVGSVWRGDMWEPNTDGFLVPTGADIGGHAYCISGYRPDRDRGETAVNYWIDNSWNVDWGISGGAWIKDTDAYSIWFEGQGEIALPIR